MLWYNANNGNTRFSIVVTHWVRGSGAGRVRNNCYFRDERLDQGINEASWYPAAADWFPARRHQVVSTRSNLPSQCHDAIGGIPG